MPPVGTPRSSTCGPIPQAACDEQCRTMHGRTANPPRDTTQARVFDRSIVDRGCAGTAIPSWSRGWHNGAIPVESRLRPPPVLDCRDPSEDWLEPG
jgi:hypothetical protein